MSTLLLRLAGPLQSWGVSSKFNNRTTEREPSKSGVIGLLAAAQGRSRDDCLDDLSSLRYGVRTDQRGTVIRDYHTAHRPENDKLSYITNRFYLADATFLIGLEGDERLLQELNESIRNPVYPLYLGRRSCPPTGKVSIGIRESGLKEALTQEPWLASDWYAEKQPRELDLDLILDAPYGNESFLARDSPVSFSQKNRTYTMRSVMYRPSSVHVINERSRVRAELSTDHDPFDQLRTV